MMDNESNNGIRESVLGRFRSFLTIIVPNLVTSIPLVISAESKPRGYYLEQFWQADLGYFGQAIIRVKIPNSSHVASIQH